MRMIRSVAVAGALACMIGAAKSDELVGTIDDINTTRNTISVGDKIFAVSPQNTVGPRIGELRERRPREGLLRVGQGQVED